MTTSKSAPTKTDKTDKTPEEIEADLDLQKVRARIEAETGLTHEQALKNMEETQARHPAQPPTDGLTAEEANARRGPFENPKIEQTTDEQGNSETPEQRAKRTSTSKS